MKNAKPRQEVITDVRKLSKGDRIEVTSFDTSCRLPMKIWRNGKMYDNFYIYNGIVKGAVVLRNSFGQLQSFCIPTIESGHLSKVYKWTGWRKVPDDNEAEYKTNRRRIWFKKYGIKVKTDCNTKYDNFDLVTGLIICKEKWQRKFEKILGTQEDKVVEATKSMGFSDFNEKINKLNKVDEVEVANEINDPVALYIEDDSVLKITFNEVNSDLFTAPFYNSIVHCINTDFGCRGMIGITLDNIYDLTDIYSCGLADYTATYKGAQNDDPVMMTYQNIISLLTSAPHEKATYERLEQCLHELAWYCFDEIKLYISMPKICCGANGLDWEKVRNMIIRVFQETFHEFCNWNPYYIEEGICELKITVYNGK